MLSKIRCGFCLFLCLLLLVACINLDQQGSSSTTAEKSLQSAGTSASAVATTVGTTQAHTKATTAEATATEDPYWSNVPEDDHTKRY